MTRILFVGPALATIADKPRIAARLAKINGLDVAVFEGTLFYRDGAAHYSTDTINGNQYAVEISDNLYVLAGYSRTDEAFKARLDALPEGHLQKYIADSLAIAADTEGYTAKAKADLAARKASREAEELRRATERQERAAKAESERISSGIKAFRAGQYVEWPVFEDLCKRFDVSMAIQTIGAARKRVSEVANGKFMVSRGHCPEGVFAASRELFKKLEVV